MSASDFCAWCGEEPAVAVTPKGPVCNSCSYKRQFEEEPRFAKKWPDEFRFGTNVLPRRFGVDSSQD